MSGCEAGLIGDTVNVGFTADCWDGWYDHCDQPVTHRISSGCVHEHVLTWDVCAGCAVKAQRRIDAGEPVNCVDCQHKCLMLVSVRALAVAP